ncbi:hypothetical protein LSH36_127g09027 [Paralvinella palmiformis]|uniref:HMG box domain-containing protein n=1 Tax=Paralvinella palmiformis TaxID=53620 RepID=A0AAD9JWP6_9ANNE|nr:hypothetical protein LSH36_127g09027 [Paralvinella palmiformis]
MKGLATMRSAHGMIGMSGIPVTGSHTKKPLPKIQTPSTWLLYSLSTERKIEPPKPPVPVFLLFAIEKRPHILNTQPGASTAQIGKQLGQMWRELPETEKDRYREIFRLNKETYKQDYDTFMANLSDVEKEQLKHNTALKRKKKLAIKTKRKLKSLNKPKKPRGAFVIYYASQMKNRGTTPITVFVKQVAQEWQVMTEHEKEPYAERAKADRDKYEAEMKAWEERMQVEGHPELVRGYKPPKLRKKKVSNLKKKAAPKKKKAAKKKKKTAKKVTAKKLTSKKTEKSKSSSKRTSSKKTKKTSSSQGDESWMREE